MNPEHSGGEESVVDLENEQKHVFLNELETSLKSGEDVAVAADFDQNISEPGPSNGLDPRDSHLNPDVRDAFLQIKESGRDVVIISSRGAQDVARIVDIPGVAIVGTLGWETLDSEGKSRINPLFDPYEAQITAILGEVEARFLEEQLGLAPTVENQPNVSLPTPQGGEVILQPKGYNDKFPQGINHTYALNLVPPEEREKYVNALEGYYADAYGKQAEQLGTEQAAKLGELCKFMVRRGKTSTGLPTLDVEIRPAQQGAKRGAMHQLMRESDDPKRQMHFKGMPHHERWIYSGDHAEQDTPVMRFEHLASKLTNGKRGGFGVWSKPVTEKYRQLPGVDVTVNSVKGNAMLLKDTASLMSKYPVQK